MVLITELVAGGTQSKNFVIIIYIFMNTMSSYSFGWDFLY